MKVLGDAWNGFRIAYNHNHNPSDGKFTSGPGGPNMASGRNTRTDGFSSPRSRSRFDQGHGWFKEVDPDVVKEHRNAPGSHVFPQWNMGKEEMDQHYKELDDNPLYTDDPAKGDENREWHSIHSTRG